MQNIQDEVYIFDTRALKKFEASHIEGDKYLGYDDFNANRLHNIPKDADIALYCSIRKFLGYSNVRNLYGSIFEWVNQGYPVVNN